MKTLQDLFLSELSDIYDAEHRLVQALPKIAHAATCTHLKDAIQTHLSETEDQILKLNQVFACLELEPKREKCEATMGLLHETDELATWFKGTPTINAALVAALQKIEHYEIASYGCLHEWATLLGNETAAEILKEILAEEKTANEVLTGIARTHCNNQAASESRESCDSE